jgi:hypothetical protein
VGDGVGGDSPLFFLLLSSTKRNQSKSTSTATKSFLCSKQKIENKTRLAYREQSTGKGKIGHNPQWYGHLGETDNQKDFQLHFFV